MNLDLDLDKADVLGLQAKAPIEFSSEMPDELMPDWRTMAGIPEFGYRVQKGSGFHYMDLWKVRFIAKLARSGSSHGQQSKCWVSYEFVECLWRGELAKQTPTHTTKEVKILSQFGGRIEDFELSLNDAVCRLTEYRDYHRRQAFGTLNQLRDSPRRMEADVETTLKYIRQLDNFRAADCVPSELLHEEDLAMEQEIEQILKEG